MDEILNAAGRPTTVLEKIKIPRIINSCKKCRVWMRPSPHSTPTVPDLMVSKTYMSKKYTIMSGHADSFHKDVQIFGKTSEISQRVMHTCWVQISGPYKWLTIVGAVVMMANDNPRFLKRKGVIVRTHTSGEHACMIERRGATTQHTMQCITQQLEAIWFAVAGKVEVDYCPLRFRSVAAGKVTFPWNPFTMVPNDSVFAGNNGCNYKDANPYMARKGYPLEMLPDHTFSTADLADGPGRYAHRIREISLQKTIEFTAIDRMTRYSMTITTPAGHAPLDLKIGDLSDLHRPATIMKYDPSRGQYVSRWKTNKVNVRHPDDQNLIDFGTFCPSKAVDSTKAIDIIEAHLNTTNIRTDTTAGFIKHDDATGQAWHKAKAFARIASAMKHFARVTLDLTDGKSIRPLPAVPDATVPAATQYTMLAWTDDISSPLQSHYDGHAQCTRAKLPSDDRCTRAKLHSDDWRRYRHKQYLHTADDDAQHLQDLSDPEVQDADSASDRLPTIPKESNEEDIKDVLWTELDYNHLKDNCVEQRPASSSGPPTHRPELTTVKGHHYYAADADEFPPNSVNEADAKRNKDVEMRFPAETPKLIKDSEPKPRLSASHVQKASVEHSTDLLAAEAYQTNRQAVAAAVLEELEIWIEQRYSRRPRTGAPNILDSKLVRRWKGVKINTIDASKPERKVRTIKMHIPVRSVKDFSAEGLVTHSSAGPRPPKRLILSEATIKRLPLTITDVLQAFLDGLMHMELPEPMSERALEVNFDQGAFAEATRRQCPGYVDNDLCTEVPKESPRRFSLESLRATDDDSDAWPLTHENQLIIRHDEPGSATTDTPAGAVDKRKLSEVRDVQGHLPGRCIAPPVQNIKAFYHAVVTLAATEPNQQGTAERQGVVGQSARAFVAKPTQTGASYLAAVSATKLVAKSGGLIELIGLIGFSQDQDIYKNDQENEFNSQEKCIDQESFIDDLKTIGQYEDLLNNPMENHGFPVHDVRRFNVLSRLAKKHPLRIIYKRMECSRRLQPIHEICSGVLFQRQASAAPVPHGPHKGLRQMYSTGRPMTAGEDAQCGRGGHASCNKNGDGPAQNFESHRPTSTKRSPEQLVPEQRRLDPKCFSNVQMDFVESEQLSRQRRGKRLSLQAVVVLRRRRPPPAARVINQRLDLKALDFEEFPYVAELLPKTDKMLLLDVHKENWTLSNFKSLKFLDLSGCLGTRFKITEIIEYFESNLEILRGQGLQHGPPCNGKRLSLQAAVVHRRRRPPPAANLRLVEARRHPQRRPRQPLLEELEA